ncbi:Uncharacterized protein FWK35_00019537, partial [Aphis craccivora]
PDIYGPGFYIPGFYVPHYYGLAFLIPDYYGPGSYSPDIYGPGFYIPEFYIPHYYGPRTLLSGVFTFRNITFRIFTVRDFNFRRFTFRKTTVRAFYFPEFYRSSQLYSGQLRPPVQALCCDTTASNTGRLKGACILLEQKLEREILYLPCRHHILEVVLRSAFEIKIDIASAPDLLELTIIFLGQTPPNGIFFKVPGPIHHARWMSKAIYSIKIFLFLRIYIKQWFCARAAALALNMDLKFIKDIILYEVIDEQISKSALKKMCEATSLAFFDDKVSSQTKIKMVKAMQSRDIESEANKRIILKPNEIYDYSNKDISDFISIQSSNFFNRFGIPMDFLDLDPKLWNENDQYKRSKELVNNINVVNDIAERGVKLIEDYNKLLTKNENQKQYLLQVVSEYRQQFPDCKKSTLSKNY